MGQIQSDALDRTLSGLNEVLRSHLARHSSYSTRVGSVDLLQCPWEELQALAKEVARVETVRNYAETTLKLDTLVGDIEEAVPFHYE